MKYTYRNKSDLDLAVMGVGEVEAGGTISSAVPLENPNLELIKEEDSDSQGKIAVIPVNKTKGRK